MSTALVELGVEELPASYVAGALEQLAPLCEAALRDARLQHGTIEVLGGPRRLALRIEDVASESPAAAETVWGPPERVAWQADGTPSKALTKFAERAGAAPDAILRRTKGGDERYACFEKSIAPEAASAIFSRVWPEVFGSLRFPKTMRWASEPTAFARPVQWLLALLDDAVVPCAFAGVESGRRTFGHRFLAPDAIAIGHADTYRSQLEEARVIVSPGARAEAIREALDGAAAGQQLTYDAEAVFAEALHMVEWPTVMVGNFDAAFLELPKALVRAVLIDHQKYFPADVAGSGQLAPHYLNVCNVPITPAIVAGNDRVLAARLRDAHFFVVEDTRRGLESYAGRLGEVTFHRKLGTLADKRLRTCDVLSAVGAGAPWGAVALEAARLAKADLLSLTVGEFPELQGTFGGHLTDDSAVANAIGTHYQPEQANSAVPQGAPGAALAVADRLDTLVGCFAAGEVPSGSADPLGLRRAALALVRIAADGPLDIALKAWFDASVDAYAAHSPKLADGARGAWQTFLTFLSTRYASWLEETFDRAVVACALAPFDGGSLRRPLQVAEALQAALHLESFEILRVTAHRVGQLASKHPTDAAPDPEAFVEPQEHALYAALQAAPELPGAGDGEALSVYLEQVGDTLAVPVRDFFDHVFVMSDDAAVRANRLALVNMAQRTLCALVDLTQL